MSRMKAETEEGRIETPTSYAILLPRFPSRTGTFFHANCLPPFWRAFSHIYIVIYHSYRLYNYILTENNYLELFSNLTIHSPLLRISRIICVEPPGNFKRINNTRRNSILHREFRVTQGSLLSLLVIIIIPREEIGF